MYLLHLPSERHVLQFHRTYCYTDSLHQTNMAENSKYGLVGLTDICLGRQNYSLSNKGLCF